MALTRKFLSALGIEQDKIDEIISAHSETMDALKKERDEYKASSEKLTNVQKELDDLKAKSADKDGKNPYELKYNALKDKFDEYKSNVEKEKETNRKTEAYKALLRNAGVSEKRLNSIIKVSDLSQYEMSDDGKFKDADKISQSIKTEWSDFIETSGTKGADVANPPSGNSKPVTKTKAEIMSIKDRDARRKAMLENAELFGIKLNNE